MTRPFGLLELGSNSLKFYMVRSGARGVPEIETRKIPWRVAHDFFRLGELGPGARGEIIEALKTIEPYAEGLPLSGMLALATGVFREIPDFENVAAEAKRETGIRIRVISGKDEANLMAKAFRPHAGDGSLFLFDLGGATTEWAWFEKGSVRECGSLRLGAIRNSYLPGGPGENGAAYLPQLSDRCDETLTELPFSGSLEAVGTGGTVKAAARCLGSERFTIEELDALIRQILKNGPPSTLKPARRAVFLPGLVIVRRIAERCRSPYVLYGKASVRSGMAGRLVRLLGTHRRRDLHATLLLHSTHQFKIRRPKGGSR